MARKKSLGTRLDSFLHQVSGKGVSGKDKLSGITPAPQNIDENTAREWLLSSGIIQNVIDAPAEDATREWIEITTNRDQDDPDSGLKGLGINRLIENRLEELGVRQKIRDLIRQSRLYNRGSFLYFGILAELPQTSDLLKEPVPEDLLRLDFLNVLPPSQVTIVRSSFDPLSSLYHTPHFLIRGYNIHPSRMHWVCRSYLLEENRGVSVLETILESVVAHETALWSLTSLLFELSVKVFQSEDVASSDPEVTMKFLALQRMAMNTQSSVALKPGENLARIQNTGISDGALESTLSFILEALAGVSRIPKSRLMGQSQGTLTGGQYDLITYYDGIAKFQELEIRPILEKIIRLIVREKRGAVYKALGGQVDQLDWNLEFRPLWKLDPASQADVSLKEAQTDQIYLSTGVISPDDVRSRRFQDLEKFSEWKNSEALGGYAENLGFQPPEIPPPETKKPESPENLQKSDRGKLARIDFKRGRK
jgi:uncharacterized protein